MKRVNMPIPDPNLKSEKAQTEPWEVSESLAAKLKTCDPEIHDHIAYLKGYIKEQVRVNRELHKKNIKLQVANQSLKNKSAVIEESVLCSECEKRMIAEAEHEASKIDTSRYLKQNPNSDNL
jgi:hypothetical protein